MDRNFQGVTPDGQNWNDLANATAGKQTSGFVPITRDYMRFPKFFQADGSWRRVVWMLKSLKDEYAPDKNWIATEENVSNFDTLKEFLKGKRPAFSGVS